MGSQKENPRQSPRVLLFAPLPDLRRSDALRRGRKTEATGQARRKASLDFWSKAPKYCHMVQGRRFISRFQQGFAFFAFLYMLNFLRQPHPANPHPLPRRFASPPSPSPEGDWGHSTFVTSHPTRVGVKLFPSLHTTAPRGGIMTFLHLNLTVPAVGE